MPSTDAISRRELLRVAGGALSVSLAGCAGSGVTPPTAEQSVRSCANADRPFPDDWPLYGHDPRNSGANPNATGPKRGVEVEWSTTGLRPLWGAPVVAGETVYVQETATHLSAYAREDGSERWSSRLDAADPRSATSLSGPNLTPAVVGDTVYVGGGNVQVESEGMSVERTANHAHLYAVDRHTGDVRWTVRPDDLVATTPNVVGDAVVFVTAAGTVYAVSRESASVAWTVSIDSLELPVVMPAVDGCRLYLASVESGFYAIDAERGELDWRLPGVRSGAPPAVAHGRVYVGGRDGTLSAIDPGTESVEWRYDAGRAVSTASPAVASGTVYVCDADGDSGNERARVHAIDAGTGEAVWSAETVEYVNSSPAVAEGVVYVAALDEVHAFDAETGERRWTHDDSGAVRAPLSVADGTVFVATLNGELYALAEST